MKTSALSLLAVAASASAQYPQYSKSTTSTVYTTSVYTVTSCAPEVTNCPAKLGSVTTDVISLYTTICPVTETESSTYSASPTVPPYSIGTGVPYTTSTVYITTEYTITSCAPTVTNCPVGSKTTETLTTTTYCPVSTPPSGPSSVPWYPPSGPSSAPWYPPSGPSGKPSGSIVPPPYSPSAPTSPQSAPILSTVTVSTCVPTVITSIYTVTPTVPASTNPGGPVITTKPYSTGSASGSYPVGPQNSTVPFTGAASAQKAGGILMVVGLVAALL